MEKSRRNPLGFVLAVLLVSYVLCYLISPDRELPSLFEWKCFLVSCTEPIRNLIDFFF